MTPRDIAMDSQDKRRMGKLKRGRGGGGSNSSRKQRKKKEEDSDIENGEIRCLCGFTHDDGLSIQCEQCLYWQHFVCFGITNDNVPESHICNICSQKKKGQNNAPSNVNNSGKLSVGTSSERSRKPKVKNDSESDSDSSQTQDTDEINKNLENGSPGDETIYVNEAKKGRTPKTATTSTSKEKKKTLNNETKRRAENGDEELPRKRSESPTDKNRNKLPPKAAKQKTPSSSSFVIQNETPSASSSTENTTLHAPTITPLVEKNETNMSLTTTTTSTTTTTTSLKMVGKKKAWAKQFREENKLLESNSSSLKLETAENVSNSNTNTPLDSPNTTPITPNSDSKPIKAIHKKKQIVQNFQNSQNLQISERTKSSPNISPLESIERPSIQDMVAIADTITSTPSKNNVVVATNSAVPSIVQEVKTPLPTPSKEEPQDPTSKTKVSLKDYQKKKLETPKQTQPQLDSPSIENSVSKKASTSSTSFPLTSQSSQQSTTSSRDGLRIDTRWDSWEKGKSTEYDDGRFSRDQLREKDAKDIEMSQSKKLKTSSPVLPLDNTPGFEPISPTHESN